MRLGPDVPGRLHQRVDPVAARFGTTNVVDHLCPAGAIPAPDRPVRRVRILIARAAQQFRPGVRVVQGVEQVIAVDLRPEVPFGDRVRRVDGEVTHVSTNGHVIDQHPQLVVHQAHGRAVAGQHFAAVYKRFGIDIPIQNLGAADRDVAIIVTVADVHPAIELLHAADRFGLSVGQSGDIRWGTKVFPATGGVVFNCFNKQISKVSNPGRFGTGQCFLIYRGCRGMFAVVPLCNRCVCSLNQTNIRVN